MTPLGKCSLLDEKPVGCIFLNPQSHNVVVLRYSMISWTQYYDVHIGDIIYAYSI